MSFDNFFDKSKNSLGSVLSNKAGDAIRSINNPILRNAAGNLLNTALPGVGGGIPNYSDNSYGAVISEKIIKSIAEAQGTIANPFPTDEQVASSTALENAYDWRARLRPKKGGEETFYAASIENGEGVTDLLIT